MSTSTLTPAIIQELLEKHREVLLASLVKMLPTSVAAASSDVSTPKGRKKKEKKAVDPDAPPKEKRPPNAWIVFAMRVEKLVRAAEELAGKTTKEDRMHTVVIKQFAASLKAQKPYDEWADDEVTEAMTTWTPPEMSKQAAAKAASVASADASDAVSVASSDAPAPAEKVKRVWSDEAKAAAAAKRAATKATKALGVGAPTAEAAPEAAAAPDAAAETAVTAAPAPKKVTVKPKKAAAPPPTDKKVDLSFFSWTHDGKEYYTNDRGDVVTTDFEWVGRFDGKVLDENAAEPADLADATLRDA